MTKVGIIEPSRIEFFSIDIKWQQAPGVADLVDMFPKQISNLRLNTIDVDMQLILASVVLRIHGQAHLVSRDFPLQVTKQIQSGVPRRRPIFHGRSVAAIRAFNA